MRLLIGGGTGFLGKALSNSLLKRGHSITILTRSPSKHTSTAQLQFKSWSDLDSLSHHDGCVNLSGSNVLAKRWTKEYKQQCFDSRIKTSKALLDFIQKKSGNQKSFFIGTSAVGFYPNDNFDAVYDESHEEPAKNPLGELCSAIETTINTHPVSQNEACRRVIFRPGTVLGEGLRTKMMIMGLSLSCPGDGRQPLPWIHIDDIIEMYVQAIEHEKFSGIYNAVAPQQVTLMELCKACEEAFDTAPILLKLRKLVFKNPVKIPGFAYKLVLGDVRASLLLMGQRVVPKRMLESGYEFKFGDIHSALKDLSRRN